MEHNGRQIMVVDDDEAMRVTLEGLIEEEGYSVVSVEDGYRAIQLTNESAFGLIFMDIQMPGINGVETLVRIKAIRPDTTVVMITGFSVEQLVQSAWKAGAFAILQKPLDLKQVLEIMNAVVINNCSSQRR